MRSIAKPPLILYLKGNQKCLATEKSIAIIGTRHPSDFGRQAGKRISKRLAAQNFVIVSGLAEGCDTAAHEGCIESHGQTIAVMAHGLHMIYPAKNKYLAEKIIDLGGCLVSEYPSGYKPFKSSFVERDRIQSGLSTAVLIIQTDIEGGTMHTARFCVEQRRILACLNFPSEHRTHKTRGNEKLILQGALPIWEAQDIEKFIEQIYSKKLNNG